MSGWLLGLCVCAAAFAVGVPFLVLSVHDRDRCLTCGLYACAGGCLAATDER